MKKTTPQKLSKRLAQYSALSLAIAGLTDVNGQIIYTDIVGDSIYNSIDDEYVLNMDNAGNPEFIIFNGLGPEGYFLALDTRYNNSVLGYSNSYDGYASALNNMDIIGNSAVNWYSIGNQTMNYASGSYGQWETVVDKYLGLRFKIGANTHYGWVQLDVDQKGLNWTVKDYAYNATQTVPGFGDSIMAGQTVLGVDDNELNKIKIVALNKSIALFNLPQATNYKLYTMTGKKVLDGNIANNTYVIEANTLATGVYIIELEDADSKAVVRKKIVL